MSHDWLADLLFTGVAAVPTALAGFGRPELAIMALVVLLVAAGLVAACLPDAPFRCTDRAVDDGDRAADAGDRHRGGRDRDPGAPL
jgi:hypothetical protein